MKRLPAQSRDSHLKLEGSARRHQRRVGALAAELDKLNYEIVTHHTLIAGDLALEGSGSFVIVGESRAARQDRGGKNFDSRK
ncbi:MAG: hypothetical protein ACRD8O_22670 [Bryobacteraceae bacterium]